MYVSWLRVRKGLVFVAMLAGGLAMWTANPVLWLWVTSRLESGTDPSMGPYALMLAGIVVTAIVLGKLLTRLNRLYARLNGSTPTIRVIVPWRRSLRGGRSRRRETDGRLPVSVLDVVMVVSVVLALAAFGTWMVVVNPTPPNIGGPGMHKH